MPVVTQRESARLDLVEHFVYLAESASIDVADRFLANAESSFTDLAKAAHDERAAAPQVPRAGQHPQVAGEGFRQSPDLLRAAP